MQIVGIIPARYASTRFPGKPLILIDGKTMIRRVYEQAIQAKNIDKIIVATDDSRIVDEVQSFGGNVVMTDAHHQNGTSRIAEALTSLPQNFDAAINIQGDEPFIHPSQLDELAAQLKNDTTQIVTLIKKIDDPLLLSTPSIIKVVKDKNNKALYFSRNAIPFFRDVAIENWIEKHTYYKHIGIYGFKTSILQQLVQLAPSALETAENLEQLRWLENGYSIDLLETTLESVSIDTPADLERI